MVERKSLSSAEVLLRQHARLGGRLVGVVGEEVPAAEHDVLELGQRDELVDERRARVGPLAEADGAHLRQRADGLRDPLPDGLDPGHERRGDGAHSGKQDAELARRRADVDRFTCGLRERHWGSFYKSKWQGCNPDAAAPFRRVAPRPAWGSRLRRAEFVVETPRSSTPENTTRPPRGPCVPERANRSARTGLRPPMTRAAETTRRNEHDHDRDHAADPVRTHPGSPDDATQAARSDAPITIREMMEAGVHFGHQTKRWNPKMKSYIFGARNGIHIIDLQQTRPRLQARLQLPGLDRRQRPLGAVRRHQEAGPGGHPRGGAARAASSTSPTAGWAARSPTSTPSRARSIACTPSRRCRPTAPSSA